MALFHVDSSGNLWLGDTSTTFTTSAPFYVTSSGAVKATSIDLTIQEEDDADGTGGGNKRIDLGSSGSKIYDFGGDIFINANDDVIVKDVLRLAETSGSVSEPSLLFGSSSASSGSSVNPVAGLTSRLVSADTHGGSASNLARQLEVANGSTYVMRFNSENDEVEIPGDIKLSSTSDIYIGTDPGSNGEVLTKQNGNVVWAAAGGSHPDSDHSSFLTSIPSEYLTQTEGDGRYVQSSGHSHSGFITQSTADGRYVNETDHSHSGFLDSPSDVIAVTSVSNGGFVNSLSFNASTKTLTVGGSNTRLASITTRGVMPQANLSYNLGGFGQVWSTVFRNSESTGSDERLKNSISDIDKGLDFINDLQPRKFKWNNDSIGFFCSVCDSDLEDASDTCDTEDCEGTSIERFTMEAERDKWQYGFIAQELLTNLDSNTAYGIANYDATDDNYFYSPNNLVAVLTKAVQELSTQVSDLTARIETLEG